MSLTSTKGKLEFIKALDMFGGKAEINFNKEGTHKTYLGAILSLCYIGSIIAVSFYSIRDYLDTTSPQTIFETQPNSFKGTLNLGDQGLELMIGV